MNQTVIPDCPECHGEGGRSVDSPLDPVDEWVPCKTCRERWRKLDREQKTVTVRYRNHRGEIALRRIVPIAIEFKATEWHPHRQWLLKCFDVDKGAERDFAMWGILEWSVE